MVKVDLVTGFLGSGKTTFLKKYARYLIDKGEKICILENDFGAVNVDMLLMSDMLGDSCDLEMVSGGCDNDCHKRRFKTKLISMGMRGYDRVIIEPSGIFDVDQFFDTLAEEPLDSWYEIGSVIAIVEADLPDKLSDASEFLLASQAATAGIVILSKGQAQTDEQKDKVISHIKKAMKNIHCQKTELNEVITKNWDDLTESDMDEVSHAGYNQPEYEKSWLNKEDAFQSVYLMNEGITPKTLPYIAKELFSGKEYGNVIRIKGFAGSDNAGWFELNATAFGFTMQPIKQGQDVLIVIGEELNKEAIETYIKRCTA